jgi:two-component system sensor histidine kinase CpxA
MRRLFLTVFLWFWLTLLGVGTLLLFAVVHVGYGYRSVVRLTLHDFLLFSLAGGIFCWWISRYLKAPLEKLSEAAAGIAEGRLDTRVDPSLIRRRDEIADLARNFDRMAERIESLVGAQRRLLGDVSHELRSPLSRLTVALGLARRGTPEEAAENLDRIGLEARRLDALIGQLLALTRIGSGVDRGLPVPFDFANLVQEVAADAAFEARARQRSVAVHAAAECMVTGFEELLRSAVENVVRNAVRYTAAGTAVEIALRCDGGRALLTVRDHGSGVPESLLPKMFQPFQRAVDSDGAGLGLAIAESAVGVHRGAIRVAKAPDGGLVVEIEIPITGPRP